MLFILSSLFYRLCSSLLYTSSPSLLSFTTHPSLSSVLFLLSRSFLFFSLFLLSLSSVPYPSNSHLTTYVHHLFLLQFSVLSPSRITKLIYCLFIFPLLPFFTPLVNTALLPSNPHSFNAFIPGTNSPPHSFFHMHWFSFICM